MTITEIESHPDALTNLDHTLDDLIRHVLKPRPVIVGSEWANRHRILSPETATSPGQYRWEFAPYQKEWLDVCCDNVTQKVVLMTAARVGKSTVLENVTGYYMANDPSAIMWLLPTLTNAQEFSQTNLDPLIRDTPVLRDLVRDKRERDSGNLKLTKRYKGGHLTLVGAESATGLHGKTIRVLLADEVDRFKTSAGKDGDPLTLAMIRTTTFQNRRKVILSSTPLLKGISHIEREFEASDRRFYHVPCPECSTYQKLEWKYLLYSDDPENPVYLCQSCGHAIPETQKFKMLLNGKWVITNPTSTTAGFHLNALYSRYISWRELVQEWKACEKNNYKRQVFINSRLGETWDESGTRVTSHQLSARLEQYNADVPTKTEDCSGVGILTAGVDIQRNPARIEFSVWGWGDQDECWLIDTQIIEGDLATETPWTVAGDHLLNTRYKTLNGGEIGIRSIAVDSGWNTERVYRFVESLKRRDTAGRSIVAIKGVQKLPRIISDRPTVTGKGTPALLYNIGTDTTKDFLFNLLQNQVAGPSYVHLPASFPSRDGTPRYMDNEILAQLTSEAPTSRPMRNGTIAREWRKVRDRNEQWDMFVYAYASLMLLGLRALKDMPVLAQKVADLQPSDTPSVTKPEPPPLPPQHSAVSKAGFRVHPSRRGKGGGFWKR